MKISRHEVTAGNKKLSDFIIPIPGLIPKIEPNNLLLHFQKLDKWKSSQYGVDQGRKHYPDRFKSPFYLMVAEESDPYYAYINSRIDVAFAYYSGQVKAKNHRLAGHRHKEIIVQKYERGQDLHEHCDVANHAAISIVLNDEFEGGELSFFNGTIVFTLNAGDAIMFPANFMFPHRVNTIASGTRYSITKRF